MHNLNGKEKNKIVEITLFSTTSTTTTNIT
jgi:hypothetical protein